MEILEFEIIKRSEQFSLLINENGENVINFNERIITNGTFLRINYWSRDQLMKLVLKNFQNKYSNSSLKRLVKPINLNFEILNHGELNLFNDLNNQLVIMENNNKLKNLSLNVNDIINMLPPRDIILYHIDQFFKLIYPFVPIFDDSQFKINILNIINLKSQLNERIIMINLSILILMMRLSYIITIMNSNLSNNASSPNDEPSINSTVLNFEINLDFIKIVNNFIFNSNNYYLINSSNVPFLQLLTLYRFYEMNSPENGDGESGNGGILSNDQLISCAYSLNLNRNNNFENDRKKSQLFKKLWFTICSLDIQQSLVFGRIPKTNFKYNDCILPIFDPFASNLQNVELEKNSIDKINKFIYISKGIYDLLNCIHQINEIKSIDEVEFKLSQMTNFFNEIVANFDEQQERQRQQQPPPRQTDGEILNQVDDLRLIMLYFTMKSMIEYYLLIHYERTNNVYKYIVLIRKFISDITMNLNKLNVILNNQIKNEFKNFRYVLIPVIIESIFKLINLLIPVVIRIKLVKFQIQIYIKSCDVIPDIPKPVNYNSFTHPDPNPLNESKLNILNELEIQILNYLKNKLIFLKTLSIFNYKSRRYYGQTKCLIDLIQSGEILSFEKIVPGSFEWNNNLFMSLDFDNLNDLSKSIQWDVINLPKGYEFFDDEFGMDIWNWGKVNSNGSNGGSSGGNGTASAESDDDEDVFQTIL